LRAVDLRIREAGVIPASDAVRFLLVTSVVVVPAVALIVSWMRRRGEPAPTQLAASV
jgi:hypothetical protein